jgi:hypothetical protein
MFKLVGLAASPLDPDFIGILREKHMFGPTSRIVRPCNISRCFHNLKMSLWRLDGPATLFSVVV